VVQFVIKKDKNKVFRFASLQGKTGQEALRRFNLSPDDLNSFIVLEGDRMYSRSAAALRVVKRLPAGWRLLYAGIILPRFIRDALYNWIARNRYDWYGKREECMVPAPDLKERFLD
jgi:predicted DCC family thiol-disulfide oxidoreductase YuxK